MSMFNQQEFEDKVYALVTQEVNKVLSKLLNKGRVQQEGFQVQRKVMRALHAVTEETVTQISYGLSIKNLTNDDKREI